MRNKCPGFILTLTLLILSISIILVTQIVSRTLANYRLSRLIALREKARVLALGGIQIAIAQLSPEQSTDSKTTPTKPQSPEAPEKSAELTENVLLYVNRPQKFELKQEIEGIDAQIELYISSELGKINLNALYDFNNKKFVADQNFDGKKIVQLIAEKYKSLLGETNIIELLEKFFKSHNGPLDDITELLTLKEFAHFSDTIFQEPKKSEKTEIAVPLTDLFTASTKTSREIQPTQISRTLAATLGFSRQTLMEANNTAQAQELAQLIKPTMNWAQEWNKVLAPRFGKEYTNIPQEIRNLFSTRFEATTFSVLASATIETTTQKVYAIIEKNISSDAQNTHFAIKKLYWL